MGEWALLWRVASKDSAVNACVYGRQPLAKRLDTTAMEVASDRPLSTVGQIVIDCKHGIRNRDAQKTRWKES
jgi:hypothetical protein